MPLKYTLPYLPLDNTGEKRRHHAYLVPVEDGREPVTGLPLMRDCFNNFHVEKQGDALLIQGPFRQGFYEFWVYGDIGEYDTRKHFFADHVVSMAHPRYPEYSTREWRDPGAVQGPVFFNFYGQDARPPYIRVSGDGVAGGDNLLTWDLLEMDEGRFNGEYLFVIEEPGVEAVLLDGAEMRGLTADLITLAPVDVSERHKIKPEPRPERITDHPRLYFDAAEIEAIRQNRHSNGNAPVYEDLRALFERAVEPAEDKSGGLWHPPGRERMFETDRLVIGAFGWLMERDERYRDAAVESFEQIIAEDYEWSIVDNQIAMVMGALVAGYDWLYHDLSDDQRRRAETVMRAKAAEWYRMKLVDRYYRQSHFMTTTYFTIGATSFVLWEKYPEEAQRWAAFARTSLERTLALCPDDGSWLGLWNYSLLSLVPYVEILRNMTGEDIFQREPFFQNTGRHWMDQLHGDWRATRDNNNSPRHRQTRNEGFWIYRFAALTQDPVLQWAADSIRPIELGVEDWRYAPVQRRVFEYLWRDPDLTPAPPAEDDLARHYGDPDLTVIRGGWEPEDFVFTTRCGSLLGHNALTQGELGSYGHSTPVANHFTLFACGERLLDMNHQAGGNTTRACCCVLVDDQGQRGADSYYGIGGPVFPHQAPYARHYQEMDGAVYVEGVATAAYDPALGLRNFTRRILCLRPDLFVIVDELAADAPRSFQFRLVSDGEFFAEDQRGRFSLVRGDAAADILLAAPPQWTQVAGETPLIAGYCSDTRDRTNFLAFDAPHKVFETTFVVLLTPRPHRSKPAMLNAQVNRADGDLVVRVQKNEQRCQVRYLHGDNTDQRVRIQ